MIKAGKVEVRREQREVTSIKVTTGHVEVVDIKVAVQEIPAK